MAAFIYTTSFLKHSVYLKGVDVPNNQIEIQWKGYGGGNPVDCPANLSAWKMKISIIDLITRYN